MTHYTAVAAILDSILQRQMRKVKFRGLLVCCSVEVQDAIPQFNNGSYMTFGNITTEFPTNPISDTDMFYGHCEPSSDVKF